MPVINEEEKEITPVEGVHFNPLYSPPSGAITSESLKPEPTIDYQTLEETPVFPVADLDTDLDTEEKTPELEMTAPETEAQTLIDQLQGLTTETVGEAGYRAEREEAQGMPELLQTQTDLSSQLKMLQAEAKQIPLQLQQEATGRGITVGGLRPLQTARLRTNAIQALGVSALLEASRGNITTAQTLIDRAVAQKYDPIKAEIAAKSANLELIINSPEYTLAERNRAQAQLDIQNARLKEEAKNEEEEVAVKNIAVNAAANGADAGTLDKIKKATTAVEAMQLAAGFTDEAMAEKQAQKEFEDKMALNGYTKLLPSQLAGLTEDQILRMPNGDIYKKPVSGELSELAIYEEKKKIDAKYKTGTGGGGGTTPTGGITKENKNLISQNLASVIGDDGFVSPDDYKLAKQDWIQAGGEPADFDKEFKGRQDPENPYYETTEGKPHPKNENDIRKYMEEGYSIDEIVEAGYDRATAEKVFNEKKSKEDKSWWKFWN